MKKVNNKTMLTKSEAAAFVGRSEQTIYNWVKSGFIHSSKDGRTVLISKEELQEYIKSVDTERKMKQRLDEMTAEYRKKIAALRYELKMIETTGISNITKELLLSVVNMAFDDSIINERQKNMLSSILDGKTLDEVAFEFNVTRERVRQIAYAAAYQVGNVMNYREVQLESREVKKENEKLKAELIETIKENVRLKDLLGGAMNNDTNAIKHNMISKISDDPNQKSLDNIVDKLNMTIDSCDLSVRTRNCLHSISVRTLGDLCTLDENELLKCRNFGMKSLKEIRDYLTTQGLRIGIDQQIIEQASRMRSENV